MARPQPTSENWRRTYEKLTSGRGDFFDLVHKPLVEKRMHRETAKAIVRQALSQGDGKYQEAARILGVPDNEYVSFWNVVWGFNLQ